MPWFGTASTPIVLGLNDVTRRKRTRPPRAVAVASPRQIIIPTDLMIPAWRQLFPAERMMVFGGRRIVDGIRLTSVVDVTEAKPSAVHVRACPLKLATALMDFERTGAHLALWMHSHPGHGADWTGPSQIDLAQDTELREHYSAQLVAVIAVKDGWLRVWGANLKQQSLRVVWEGRGIDDDKGDPHVFRIQS